jgi:hypothetical protein
MAYTFKRFIPREKKMPNGMNQSEMRYAELLECMKRAGDIRDYRFQAMTFKLADDTRYTPDFVVTFNDRMELHEVKGFLREDAAVKFKVAAHQFQEFGWKMVRWEKKTGWSTIAEY